MSPPVGFYPCYTLPLGFPASLPFLFLFPVLHAADTVGQTHQTLGKMYILNYNIIWYIQVHMGKIPDCLDSGIHQTVCDLRSLGLRNGERCHLNVIVLDELLQVVNAPDFNTADYQTDESRVDIEHTFDDEAALFKIRVIRNGLILVLKMKEKTEIIARPFTENM